METKTFCTARLDLKKGKEVKRGMRRESHARTQNNASFLRHDESPNPKLGSPEEISSPSRRTKEQQQGEEDKD